LATEDERLRQLQQRVQRRTDRHRLDGDRALQEALSARAHAAHHHATRLDVDGLLKWSRRE